MKIVVLAIGKPKSRPIRELVEDYSGRISHYLKFNLVSCRDDKQALVKIEGQDFLVILDERGAQKTSTELAALISKHQMQGTKRVVFFIGGQDGVGSGIRKRANLVLGLSNMTFPHELVQVILTEQIYRALTILKGEPYHRQT